jgi:hypothetical protein
MRRALALALVLTSARTAAADAPPPGSSEPPSEPLLVVDGELAAGWRYAARSGDDLQELRLERAELGAWLRLSPERAALALGLEVRAEAIRSAGAQSVFGIDGDSLLLRPRRAQVRGAWTPRRGPALSAAVGLIEDPWVELVGTRGQLRAWSSSASERHAAWEPSDVGARLGARLGPASLTVAATTGEGRRYPERNDGTNLTAVARVDARLAAVRAGLALVARDGSLGPGAARDRRAGGAVLARSRRVDGCAELVRVLGRDGDGGLTGWAWAISALGRPHRWLVASARAGGVRWAGGDGALEFGGAVGVTPPVRHGAELELSLVVERTAVDGAPLADSDGADATTVMLVLAARTGARSP